MAGTSEGARKAREKIIEKYGESFYADMGRRGGTSKKNINQETGKAMKGFALDAERAKEAGRRGALKRWGKL